MVLFLLPHRQLLPHLLLRTIANEVALSSSLVLTPFRHHRRRHPFCDAKLAVESFLAVLIAAAAAAVAPAEVRFPASEYDAFRIA